MPRRSPLLWSLVVLLCALGAASGTDAGEPEIVADAAGRWPRERAGAWAERTPWLVGCNYLPSSAVNQLEMWQADTFDPETIDRELGYAESLGFTSVRVFLHDLLWKDDPDGFLDRWLATDARPAERPVPDFEFAAAAS